MFDINRRGFLGSLLAGALILPTQAQALIMGDRYVRLVASLKGVIDKNKLATGFQPKLSRNMFMIDKQAHEEFLNSIEYYETLEHLMNQMLTEFNAKPVDVAAAQSQITALFNKEIVIDVMSDADLRRYEDCIVTVGVMRYLFSDKKIYIRNRGKLPSLKLFTNYFHYLIVR